jgi:hypothetical protein
MAKQDWLLSEEEIDILIGNRFHTESWRKLCYEIAQAQLAHCEPLIRADERAKSQSVIGELSGELWNTREKLEALESKDTWYWQGDGEDHLESLTCPIIITPEKLKTELQQASDGEAKKFEGWKSLSFDGVTDSISLQDSKMALDSLLQAKRTKTLKEVGDCLDKHHKWSKRPLTLYIHLYQSEIDSLKQGVMPKE